MAAGDYNVSLPEQEISELDQIGKAFNELAANLKTATEELKDEAKRLVRLEDTQKRFIADASHEIRAPLATMAITLDAWKDGLLRGGEGRRPRTCQIGAYQAEQTCGTAARPIQDRVRQASDRTGARGCRSRHMQCVGMYTGTLKAQRFHSRCNRGLIPPLPTSRAFTG